MTINMGTIANSLASLPPLPWRVHDEFTYRVMHAGGFEVCCTTDGGGRPTPTAAFIANAPSTIIALAKEVELLAKERNKARARVEQLEKALCEIRSTVPFDAKVEAIILDAIVDREQP